MANAKFIVEAALMETSPVTGNLRLTDAGVRLVAPFLVELFKAALEQADESNLVSTVDTPK